MAKKKIENKTVIEETVPDGSTLDGNNAPGDFTFDLSIIKVKVYKMFAGKSKPSFCFERAEEISESELQNLYGGGTYSIETFFDNGTKRTDVYEIADPPADPQQRNKPRSVEEIQIEMYREQSKMNRDLLMAVLGRGNTQSTMAEIAQMWAIMQGGMPAGGNGFEKFIGIFEKGLEIGANKGGDMDWKSMLVGTVKDMATQFAPAINAAVTKQPGNGNGAQIPTTFSAEQMLKLGIQELKSRIVGGLPVGFAIEWAQLNAANPQYQPLIAAAASKSFEDLCAIDPELANEPYATWTKSFLTGVKQYIQQAGQLDVEEDEQQ